MKIPDWLYGIVLGILFSLPTFLVLTGVAHGEPHAAMVWSDEGKLPPPGPGQPKRGTLNFYNSTPLVPGRLEFFRAETLNQQYRRDRLRAAELSAPRTTINVRPTVVIERRDRFRGERRLHRSRR